MQPSTEKKPEDGKPTPPEANKPPAAKKAHAPRPGKKILAAQLTLRALGVSRGTLKRAAKLGMELRIFPNAQAAMDAVDKTWAYLQTGVPVAPPLPKHTSPSTGSSEFCTPKATHSDQELRDALAAMQELPGGDPSGRTNAEALNELNREDPRPHLSSPDA